jgi:hypothetical protein
MTDVREYKTRIVRHRTGENNYNYLHALDFIYCFSHAAAFECGTSVFDLRMSFVYIGMVVYCHDLSNVM